MIDVAAELAAWKAAFPEYVDWDLRLGRGLIKVMAKHRSRAWGMHSVAFMCMAEKYDRESAFAEERSVRTIMEQLTESTHGQVQHATP